MNSTRVLPDLHDLPLREKIAQLLMVRVGSNMPPARTVDQDKDRVERLLGTCPVGGLLLFHGGARANECLQQLQARSRVPLLVGSDIERGVGQQVPGYTLFPHAMAFGQLGDDGAPAVRELATTIAREAAEVGIHITFAPVVDANTNPRNPIIATRAFSEDSVRAAELTQAFVAAAESAGLRTAAKHFPGHGATHKDSHDSLPVVTRSLAELRACELPPFQSAIDAGCSLVMTAHVAYPALDRNGVPATLSQAILRGLLREQMGFQGVICSDSLLMAGVRERFKTEQEMAFAALLAGVDLLLDLEQPSEVIDYLCKCVENGTLPLTRVEEALERVWTLKRHVFCVRGDIEHSAGAAAMPANKFVRADELKQVVAQRVARGAIKLIHGDPCPALPLKPEVPLVAILLKPFETSLEPPEQPVAAELRKRIRAVQYIQLGPSADGAAYDRALQIAASAPQLLIAVIVRPAAWHTFGLRPEQQMLVQQLTNSRPVVLASLGVPYILDDFPAAAARICAYSDVPVSQKALAEFLVI